MTDKELKKMLKNTYALPTTESEKSFIRKYEKRSFQLFDIIKLEFRYMGPVSLIAGVILCLLFMIAVKTENADIIWIFSSLLPVCAVIPMILLSKSGRYGMDEMEASCRFSLKFIRLVRMCIIGIFAFGLLSGAGIIMKALYAFTITEYTACVIIPYLISDFGAMLVTRRWHGKENIYGIFAVSIASGLLPFALNIFRKSVFLPDAVVLAVAAFLLVAVIRESFMYIKESESVSWNLC